MESGSVERDVYSLYMKNDDYNNIINNSEDIKNNSIKISGGDVHFISGIWLYNYNNSGTISNNSINVTGEVESNINISNVFIINNNSGTISNNSISVTGRKYVSSIGNIDIFNNSGTVSQNIINITDGEYGDYINNIDISDNSGTVSQNIINIINGRDIKRVYSVLTNDNDTGTISQNIINIINGRNIESITDVGITFGGGKAGVTSNNSINIVDGIVNREIISTSLSTEMGVYNSIIDSNSIFIGGNSEIGANVYAAKADVYDASTYRSYYKAINAITNNKIFIASDLSSMKDAAVIDLATGEESIGASIYGGSKTFTAYEVERDEDGNIIDYKKDSEGNLIIALEKPSNNGIYFLGDTTKLLDNSIIKDDTNIVLANVNRAEKNYKQIKNAYKDYIRPNRTKITIDKNINYTLGNDILLDGDIALYYNMINGNINIIRTNGKIGILDDLYFSTGKRIAIGLMSSDTTELKENESFVLFKGDEGIDENLTTSLFGLAKDSDIKNFKITIDKDNGTINLEYSPIPMEVIDEDNNKDNDKSLLPDISGAIYRTTKNNFINLANKVNNRLLDLEDNEEMESNWMGIYSGKTKQNSNKDFDAFESKNTGFILGKEFINTKEIKLGGIFNYDFNKMESDYKNIDANSFGLSTYLSYNFSNTNLYFNGVLSYAYSSFREESTNSLDLKSKYGSNQIFTNVMFGLRYDYFEPQIGLNYSYVSVNSYKDSYGNNVDRNNFDALATSVGLVFKNFIDVNYYESIILKPKVFVGYDVGIKKPDLKVSGRLNANDSKYKIKVGTMDENAFHYGINLDLELFSKVDMTLGYEGVKGKEYKGGEFGLMGSFGW